MKKGSLDQVIGDMVRQLGTPGQAENNAEQSSDLGGIEALTPADPILAALHRQYIEAGQSYRKLLRENGAGDPMAEVAADFLDSARSAVQTRLLELQDFREYEIREEMKKRMRAKQAEREAMEARRFYELRKREKGDDMFFWFVMLYWLVGRTFKAARKTLSAANDFALVSVVQDKRRYAAGS